MGGPGLPMNKTKESRSYKPLGYHGLNLHGFSGDIRLHRRLEDIMALIYMVLLEISGYTDALIYMVFLRYQVTQIFPGYHGLMDDLMGSNGRM